VQRYCLLRGVLPATTSQDGMGGRTIARCRRYRDLPRLTGLRGRGLWRGGYRRRDIATGTRHRHASKLLPAGPYGLRCRCAWCRCPASDGPSGARCSIGHHRGQVQCRRRDCKPSALAACPAFHIVGVLTSGPAMNGRRQTVSTGPEANVRRGCAGPVTRQAREPAHSDAKGLRPLAPRLYLRSGTITVAGRPFLTPVLNAPALRLIICCSRSAARSSAFAAASSGITLSAVASTISVGIPRDSR
jgi:hypothetical protein